MISLGVGSNPLTVVKKMKRLLGVFVAIIFIQSIFTKGEVSIIAIGGIAFLTREGIIKGVELALRMAIIIISATIVATSNPREIIQGLVQWRVPYEIAFMVSIAIRFLPLLVEEIKDTVTAIQLRGVELEGIPMGKKIRIYSYIFMPVVASTLMKARKLSTAMETRGFAAYPSRTSFKVLKTSTLDYSIMAISWLAAICTIKAYLIMK